MPVNRVSAYIWLMNSAATVVIWRIASPLSPLCSFFIVWAAFGRSTHDCHLIILFHFSDIRGSLSGHGKHFQARKRSPMGAKAYCGRLTHTPSHLQHIKIKKKKTCLIVNGEEVGGGQGAHVDSYYAMLRSKVDNGLPLNVGGGGECEGLVIPCRKRCFAQSRLNTSQLLTSRRRALRPSSRKYQWPQWFLLHCALVLPLMQCVKVGVCVLCCVEGKEHKTQQVALRVEKEKERERTR